MHGAPHASPPIRGEGAGAGSRAPRAPHAFDFEFGQVRVFADSAPGGASPEDALLARLGPGDPLPSSVRASMEARLGYRFPDVRIHRGGVAASEAAARGARALTVAHHIAFAGDAYRPGTLLGDALLAHELAHTVQQRGTAGAAGASDAALEAEADTLAAEAALGKPGHSLSERQGLRIQAAACAAVPTGTLVTPAHFNFQTSIPATGSPVYSGGWQVACLHATLSKTIQGGPTSSFVCRIEIGMPILHHAWGRITPTDAATRAATAANAAAYGVLSSLSYPVTQADCNALHTALRIALNAPAGGKTLGARVGDCVTPGITPTRFP